MAPPRKKPRQSDVSILIPSNVSSPVPSHMQGSSGPAGIKPKLQSPPGEDGWTPEQETALLTAIIEHKPAGPLKHFRMVAISQAVQSRAQTGPPNEDEYIEEQHLAIPGIWKKLRTLYNMEAVWERVSGGYDIPAWKISRLMKCWRGRRRPRRRRLQPGRLSFEPVPRIRTPRRRLRTDDPPAATQERNSLPSLIR